jgi:membrane carboxypeptidase/penicillin-binding protein
MWIQFMQAALKGRPEHTQEQPPGIVSVRIDPISGTRVSGNDPQAIFEYFMEQNVPSANTEDNPDTESVVPTGTIDAPATPGAGQEQGEPTTTNQTAPEGNGGVY